MSAPLSPRSEAILDAVERHGFHGATVEDVTDWLDLTQPDREWLQLTQAQRRATVRRYLGRFADDDRVIRIDEGVFGPVYDVAPRQTAVDPVHGAKAEQTSTSAAKPSTPPTELSEQTLSRPRRFPRQDTSQADTSHDHDDHDDHDDEGHTMTETTTPQDTSADETPTQPLRALLDSCPLAPWPQAVYDALNAVTDLDERRTRLDAERNTAASLAEDAEAEVTSARVDGSDPTDARAAAAKHRAEAAELDRAIAELDRRGSVARLAVIRAQADSMWSRVEQTRADAAAHRARTQQLVDELEAHAGIRYIDPTESQGVRTGWPSTAGKSRQLERDAERLTDQLVALEAVAAGLPLGFHGSGISTVQGHDIGTLTGVAGVPALVDVERVDPATPVPGAVQLVSRISAKLA